MNDFSKDRRFDKLNPLKSRAHLAIATLHQEDEMKYIEQVYRELSTSQRTRSVSCWQHLHPTTE